MGLDQNLETRSDGTVTAAAGKDGRATAWLPELWVRFYDSSHAGPTRRRAPTRSNNTAFEEGRLVTAQQLDVAKLAVAYKRLVLSKRGQIYLSPGNRSVPIDRRR